MSKNKLGKQTLRFSGKPVIAGTGSIVGKKEGEGPMAKWFDVTLEEDTYGEKTWEKAESRMLKEAMLLAMKKAGKNESQMDAMLSGDLLNQLMSSSFTAREDVYKRQSYESDIPSLRVFMATLRKKIETDTSKPRFIQTHVGVGYRMLKVEDAGS